MEEQEKGKVSPAQGVQQVEKKKADKMEPVVDEDEDGDNTEDYRIEDKNDDEGKIQVEDMNGDRLDGCMHEN